MENLSIEERIEKMVNEFNTSKIGECEKLLEGRGTPYVLCTLDENGGIKLKDEASFHQGDYMSLMVDLSKLPIPYPTYYVCGYWNVPIRYTELSSKYLGSIMAGKGMNVGKEVECNGPFRKEGQRVWVLSGFALDMPGSYVMLRLYVFNGSLSPSYDFKNNLDKGEKIFELKGEIV